MPKRAVLPPTIIQQRFRADLLEPGWIRLFVRLFLAAAFDRIGPEQAFANRYITLSNYAWLSAIVAGLILLPKLGAKMRILFVLALCGYVLAKSVNDTSAINTCLLYTSPSPRDQRGSRMPSSA